MYSCTLLLNKHAYTFICSKRVEILERIPEGWKCSQVTVSHVGVCPTQCCPGKRMYMNFPVKKMQVSMTQHVVGTKGKRPFMFKTEKSEF